jgi:(p)ppGpp synthase/HD superfamily hydrolase
MIYTPLTKQALRLCFEAHKAQTDKTGLPYVFHPFHLAEQMKDEISTVCALLHDVIEDTDYTLEDLAAMGFPDEVLEVLRLLTHAPEEPYMDYVERLSHHPVARQVKLADLRHNSDLTRMDESEIDEWALARTKRYKQAMRLLRAKKLSGRG